MVSLTVAFTLSAGLISGLPWLAVAPAQADGEITPEAKVADPETYQDFPGRVDAADYYSVSRVPGRVWTDKSVFARDQDVPQAGASPTTLEPNELGVALSAVGSTRHVTSQVQVAIDLVIVLDNSYSMLQCIDSSSGAYCNTPTTYQRSRAYAMVQAVNSAIKIIAADNPNNRVAIVQFGTTASVLESLGTPQKVNTDDYVTLTPPTQTGWTTTPMILNTKTQHLDIGGGNTAQSTNTQAGVWAGMNILATQAKASVTALNQRIPNVLLFSDGESTLSYADNEWWNIDNFGTQGPGQPVATIYPGNGFKAAMTAAFLKNKIADVYNDAAYNASVGMEAVVPHVYTVGLGVTALSAEAANFALATLDPKGQLGNLANTIAPSFVDAWNTYNGGGSPGVTVQATGDDYTVTHPTDAAYDPAGTPDGLAYNDKFYSPLTPDDMLSVFQAIAQEIIDAAPQFPITSDDTSGQAQGYLTFTDPLGPFMQVTDMNHLAFCAASGAVGSLDCVQTAFTDPTKKDLGNGKYQYTFTGAYTANTLVQNEDVSKIIVTVQTSTLLQTGDVVTFQIPVTLLPLRDAKILLDANGQPVSMAQAIAHPVRLFYKVAPKAGVLEALGNPISLNVGGSSAGTALAQYIRTHTVDGLVRFYSNDYTVQETQPKAASAATFVPSIRNDFYRFAHDTPLFADTAATVPLTQAAWLLLGETDHVYFNFTEYYLTGDVDDPVDVRVVPYSIPKGSLTDAQGVLTIQQVAGQMVAPAGLPAVMTRHSLDHAKCADLQWLNNQFVCAQAAESNLSGTDPMARYSEYLFATDSVFTALGNDGYMSYKVPGTLTIRKTIDAAPGLSPDTSGTVFTFRVDLRQADAAGAPLAGTFPYSVFSTSDTTTPIATGTVGHGGQLQLTASQVVTVFNLPDEAHYTVTELALPSGYTQAVPTAGGAVTGTIDVDSADVDQADFTNRYAPAPVSADAPSASKELLLADGGERPWLSGDAFTMRMCGPAEKAGSGCVSTTFTTASHGARDFGDVEFTEPGTFTYSITEVLENRAGFSYSGAAYTWRVSVADDGWGQLRIAGSTLTQALGDDGAELDPPAAAAEAAFSNTFDADSTQVQLSASKLIDDRSVAGDDLRTPSRAYDFDFEYVGADDDEAPEVLFGGTQRVARVRNTPSSSSLTAPGLTFTSAEVGHTYYYKAAEVAGTDPATTYDEHVFFWALQITVVQENLESAVQWSATRCVTTRDAVTAQNPWGGCDPATATYSDTVTPQFVNVYAPAAASVTLDGAKALTGRPWSDADSFTFTLAATEAGTVAAIDSRAVTLPDTLTRTVTKADLDAGQAAFSLGPIRFGLQGNYQFTVTEVVPAEGSGPDGVNYDTHVLYYDVAVTDTPPIDGVLDAVATPRDGTASTVFTNRYQASTSFGGVNAVKALSGRALAAGEFEFTVHAVDEASCAKAGFDPETCELSATNPESTGASTATHLPGEFDFTQADLGVVYRYQVWEEPGGLGGVAYDDRVWDLT
ncbi:MAG: DUF5979 domain-containing protein, partial [Propionibacteriaceae bacterium]|nr:DUF5979 domain-containing protein [Propionibacteriaceae bacterium]